MAEEFMDYIWDLTRHISQIALPFPLKEKEIIHPPPRSFAYSVRSEIAYLEMSVVRIAGISGAFAVGLGAYGAHVLRERSVDERRSRAFETGNRYHLIHSVAMLGAVKARYPLITASLFLAGIALFSGTIYHYSLTGKEHLRRYTPFGGMLFIIGWLSMIL